MAMMVGLKRIFGWILFMDGQLQNFHSGTCDFFEWIILNMDIVDGFKVIVSLLTLIIQIIGYDVQQ